MLVVGAIENERALQAAEARHGDGEAHHSSLEEQGRLVSSISHLNSVANFHRKGRDDLSPGVLVDAVRTVRRCDEAERNGEDTEVLRAARILAGDVVQSFDAMRAYLREAAHCLERVDPHLCNNAGLVARLVDWEESWEVGTRYVQREKLLNAVCDIVAEIRAAQRVVPALTSMLEDCDVELFLVLPRIIWLGFLARPLRQMELLCSLLPHRFPDSKSGSDGQGHPWDAELESFVQKYQHTKELLIAATYAGALSSPSVADVPSAVAVEKCSWEFLVKRIVRGAAAAQEDVADHVLLSASRNGGVEAVEDLMRDLERWSIELQRHCPEDWNQCSAILVQCLTGPTEKSKQVPFHV